MANTIVLTVPESVSALYVVTVPDEPTDPEPLVRARVGFRRRSEARDLTLEALDGGSLHVEVQPAAPGVLPLDLLRIFGATEASLDAIDRAPYSVVVEAVYAPGWPPVHEVVARTAAAAVAHALHGQVIDAQVPRVLSLDRLDGSVPEDGQIVLSDYVLVPQSSGARGTWLTTKGLGRFGLPELQALDVPSPLGPAWTAILSGAAYELLDEFAGVVGRGEPPAIVELPEVLEVGLHAMAAAYGEQAEGDDLRAPLRLEFTPASEPGHDEFLTVRPPRGYPEEGEDFHAWVVAELFDEAGGPAHPPGLHPA